MIIPPQPLRFLWLNVQTKQRSFKQLTDYIAEHRSLENFPNVPRAEITYPFMQKFISELPYSVINWEAAFHPDNHYRKIYTFFFRIATI